MLEKILRLLTVMVLLAIPASAQKVPTTEEVLGFKVGSDYHLATYEQAVDYLKALEKASPRIKVIEMGQTEAGRTMIYAVITSEQNMGKLERYKEISRRLAQAKGLTDEEAHRLSAEGKSIVLIGGGMHADECAPAQGNIQFAYDMVTSEAADFRLIRDNAILLLFFPNPDGMTMLADWYRSNLGTPYEVSDMPFLYNKYVGHDITRDSDMNNLKEVQNITRIVNREWYPVVLYDHHQTAPFPARIWIPPAAEPTNPNLHPLFVRGKNLIGTAMGYTFDREGKPGAISRSHFDFIYPGYEDSFGDYFNIVSIMTETAHYAYATPKFYTVDEFPAEYRDFTMGAFYPSPWKGGWWRLKDGMEYANTASKAVLHTAALYREMFLYDKYQMGRDTIEKFKKEPPYAWIVPQDQWDPPVAARLLDNLAFSGVEVYRAAEPFVSGGISYPAGTWVIPMDQAFSRFAKAVLEEQEYPDLIRYSTLWQGIVKPSKFPGAYLPPYDMAGWTLPYQMGVKVRTAGAPLNMKLEALDKVVPAAGTVESAAGYAFLISPRTNNSYIAMNRILKKAGEVQWSQESFSAGSRNYPPGTFIVPSGAAPRSLMESLSKELYLDIGGAPSQVTAKTYKLKTPRVGLYKSYAASMDEGWTRWLFEHYEFPYTSIYDAEIKTGELGRNFDVIVIPSNDSDSILKGNKPGKMPPQYTGGITATGVRNLKEFVEGGGTLVALNAATVFALDKLGLPVKDALAGLQAPHEWSDESKEAQIAKFACPGSVLRMEFDPKHPVAYGMPEKGTGMFYESTAFDILPGFEGKGPAAIAKYPAADLLASGYLTGENYLVNKVAAADVPLGKGRVILLGFGVQNRAQPHATFKLLFNSLYYGAVNKPSGTF